MKKSPLRRKTPLRPKTKPMISLESVKSAWRKVLNKVHTKRAAKRKALSWDDQWGPDGFGDFIRGSGCVVARQTGSAVGCLGPIQHCHRRSRGAGGHWKNNSFGACLGHHAEEHTKGQQTFERTYGLDLDLECAALTHQYERMIYGW